MGRRWKSTYRDACWNRNSCWTGSTGTPVWGCVSIGGNQYNVFADLMDAPRIVYYARHDTANEATAKMLKDVEKHLRDQVVLRCCAILEDPKNRTRLSELFEDAYSRVYRMPRVATNIRSGLHLAVSKMFPNGISIVSNNLFQTIRRGGPRPRRRKKAKENETQHQPDIHEPMLIHVPLLEAADTHSCSLLYSVLSCIATRSEGKI